MCKHKYIYRHNHSSIGKECPYSDLPTDDQGLCIFHSHNFKWKRENDFKGLFLHQLKLSNDSDNNFFDCAEFVFVGEEIISRKNLKKHTLQLTNKIFNDNTYFTGSVFVDSVEINNITFKEGATFLEAKFTDGLELKDVYFKGADFAKATFEKGVSFNHTDFSNSYALFNGSHFNCKAKFINLIFNDIVDFSNTFFQPNDTEENVIFEDIIFENYLNFTNSRFDCQVIFRNVKFNSNTEFVDTLFNMITSSIRYRDSAVEFRQIEVNEYGILIFKSTNSQSKMFEDYVSFNFKSDVKGTIKFENVNFSNITNTSRKELNRLSKLGKVEIGKGCLKYYCQTEIFTITASRAAQNLILDIVKVFCHYFELQENSNLGIEIVERDKSLIRYFYFTDENISYAEFLEKINRTEYNLWETFSNLSTYSINSVKDIEKKNLLIDIAGLFLKLGNYTQNQITQRNDIPKILNSISAKAMTHIDNNKEVIINIYQGESVVQTDELSDMILNKVNSFTSTIPKVNLFMKVNQNFYGSVENVINADNFFDGNKEISPEDKALILEEAIEIKNEQLQEVKKNKWGNFIERWAGTISEIAMPVLKELLIPK